MKTAFYPLSKQRFVFTSGTLSSVFDAESAMLKLDEFVSKSRYCDPLKKILLGMEVLSTLRLDHKKVPVAAYFWASSQNLEKKGELKLKRDIPTYLKKGLTDKEIISIQDALNYSSALKWATENIELDSRISYEDLKYFYIICKKGFIEASKMKSIFSPFSSNATDIDGISFDDLMLDLCEFASKNEYTPLIQSSLAHMQIIHVNPFDEETDKIGLALSHLIHMRRGVILTKTIIPFTWAGFVQSSLRDSLRLFKKPDASLSQNELNIIIEDWIRFNSQTTLAAVSITEVLEKLFHRLENHWKSRLNKEPQLNSAIDKLLIYLLGTPAVSLKSAANAIDKSLSATNDAMSQLVTAGIVHPFYVNNKERVFVAREAIDCIVDISSKLDLK